MLSKYALCAVFCAACIFCIGPAHALDHAEAAKILANELGIPTTSERGTLYGLFPGIWPGGYEGDVDIAYPDRQATLENAIVALVRWAGWDTVAYDRTYVTEIKKFTSPEGFPYYKFSPSPRSVPYVATAITAGLLSVEEIKGLRLPVDQKQLSVLVRKVKAIVGSESASVTVKPQLSRPNLAYPTGDGRLAVLTPGFHAYGDLQGGLPGRILDLAGPEIRLFTPGSSIGNGRQSYFPLGPLESLFSVGVNVASDDLSHQSQAIYGLVDNRSSTVNAVGIWGAGKSWERDARVWGGVLVAETANSPTKDAQVIGQEIDVINNSLPGVAPNASKTGIQIVGIGSAPVTDAIRVIGAGPAKWSNGIVFASNSLLPGGAILGIEPGSPLSRGLDLSNVRFTDSAIALDSWSAITFKNKDGPAAALFSDSDNAILIRTGSGGLRVINERSELVAEFTPAGDIITPRGRLSELYDRVNKLEQQLVSRAP